VLDETLDARNGRIRGAAMAVYWGAGVDAVKPRQPAAEIVRELCGEAVRLLARWGQASSVSAAVR
jgi:hypothetical protein